MAVLRQFAKRIEHLEALDAVARPVAGLVGRAVRPRLLRNLLSGTNLGHPLHPPLTDVPIGAWTMAVLLDTAGGRRAQPAADLLVAAGIAAAVPTAVTGLNDWSDTRGSEQRVGVVHAGANTVALGLYTASLVARRTGRRGLGKALALAGLGALTVGAYLGGHLGYVRGVNVNHTAFEERAPEWIPVLADSELAEGEPRKVQAGENSVLLHRDGGAVRALSSTCSHLGGPLEEGEFHGGQVTCPWHGSTFDLADGSVFRGPASSPQPCYDTRVVNGQIEVRARP